MQKVLIIGAGNMGEALASGLLSPGKVSLFDEVAIFDVHTNKTTQLAKKCGAKVCPSLEHACDYEVVILCVKPHDLLPVASQLQGKLKPNALIISLLAGVTLDKLARTMQWQGAIVRSMPNIAAKVNAAATAMCANSACNDRQRSTATSVFECIGIAVWVDEQHMDTVTGLSGSGPAYVFMVIEALIDGGVRMGLSRQVARELTIQTVLGSAELVTRSKLHPAILKDQVTTPAGTTINAIHELESRGLRAMLMSAVETATVCSARLANLATATRDGLTKPT